MHGTVWHLRYRDTQQLPPPATSPTPANVRGNESADKYTAKAYVLRGVLCAIVHNAFVGAFVDDARY